MVTCKLCQGSQWLDIRVDPIPPWSDFMSVDQDVEPCWVCNPDGSVECPEIWPENGQSTIPYYLATAIGGFGSPYGLLQGYDTEGNGTHTFLLDRKFIEFSSWQPPQPIEDCPVCHQWGITSIGGHIYDCIACGGYPIESRLGYEPLYSYWVNWKLGHRTILTPRGAPGLEELECNRASHPHIGDCLVATLEEIPGMVRVQ